MNFKTWKIKVTFTETEFDSLTEEKQSKIMMEHTLAHLVNDCDFMPRQNDVIGDLEGENDLFLVETVALHPHAKAVEFVLSIVDED